MNLIANPPVSFSLPPWRAPLRDWQQAAFDQYRAEDKATFFTMACPSAGKTTLTLRMAHWLLARGTVRWLIIVVPTDQLRNQWANAAARFGIQLTPDWTQAGRENLSDYHGIVATYAAVAKLPDLYRAMCAQPTFVALDEVHHAADALAWGGALRRAFDPAAKRLLLSGTPFRSDGGSIPYVTYRNGVCVPDFSFTLGNALQAEISRNIMFPSFEGRMSWIGVTGETSATFADPLPDPQAVQRLRTALDPRGDWLRAVMLEADQYLSRVRDMVQRDAGGLIVTIDQQHARAVAALLAEITGTEPTLAISEDPRAGAKIEAFGRGASRWLVAVRLVSEGVDIPRLYCGVFATNVLSRLYFLQLVGRFTRKTPDLDGQVAALFLPAIDTLTGYAQQVREEQQAALEAGDQQAREAIARLSESGEEDDLPPAGQYAPLSSEAEAAGAIFDGAHYPQPVLDEAARRCASLGIGDPGRILFAASVLAFDAPFTPPTLSSGAMEPARTPVYLLRRRMRSRRQAYVQMLGQIMRDLLGRRETGVFSWINDRLAGDAGAYVSQASLRELQDQCDTLNRWIQEAREAVRQGTGSEWLDQWRS